MNHGDSSELCELGVEHGTRKVSTPREGSSAQMAGGRRKRQKTRKDDYFLLQSQHQMIWYGTEHNPVRLPRHSQQFSGEKYPLS